MKRLEYLENARRTQIAAQGVDSRALLMEKLNGVAERLRADLNWVSAPRPTLEELKRRIQEFFAATRK